MFEKWSNFLVRRFGPPLRDNVKGGPFVHGVVIVHARKTRRNPLEAESSAIAIRKGPKNRCKGGQGRG
jgi:hypothetical protein